MHGGHVLKDDDPEVGFDNWRKCVDGTDLKVPLLIENTAGGDNAMARRLDRIARLWEASSRAEGGGQGRASASTPAMRTRAAWRWRRWSTRSRRSPAGSTSCTPTTAATSSTPAPTATPTSAKGRIDPDELVGVVRAAGAPVVVETPGGAEGQAADIGWLRERVD